MASTLEVRPLIGRRALETRIHVDIFHVPFSNNGMSVSDLAEEIANFLGCQLACLRICFNGGVLLDGAADLRAAGVCSSSFVVALVEECDALKLSWIDAAADGMLPAGTVFAGSEATGTRLALGRASHASGAHPGKCARELGGCRFGWGGNEVSASAYQVLVARDSKGRPWPQYFQLPQGLQRNRHGAVSLGLPCRPLNKDSSLPPGAFEAGYEADGTRLYAAAGIDPAGALCPGKLQRGWDGAAVGWGGCERSLRQHSCSAYHQGLHYRVTMVRHPFQRLDHEGISPAWLSYSRGHLLHDLKIWRSQRHECSRQPFAPFQLADLACCIAMI